MLRSIGLLSIYLFYLQGISSENLNGIYTVDSCHCSSPSEKCEPTGPFTFDQQKQKLTIKFGPSQIGTGSLGSKGLDLTLNDTRCKGSWNGQTHLAELKCQHQAGITCVTTLRCVVGACMNDQTTITVSSSSMANDHRHYFSLLFISMFILFV